MRSATLLSVLTVLPGVYVDSAPAATASGYNVGSATLKSRGDMAGAGTKLEVLNTFKNLKGIDPHGILLADGAGNFYGTTYRGGAHNMGTVFEISPLGSRNRSWRETVLKSFDGGKGGFPCGGVVGDGKGNLYGTTQTGGINNNGVVFKLSPGGGGKKSWKATVIQTFYGANGNAPCGSLVFDPSGNLYGTTAAGGNQNYGIVFELSPPNVRSGAWTETVLFNFDKTGGWGPYGNLILDSAGNLYGTTPDGGNQGAGVVFELRPPLKEGRAWTEKVLLDFNITNGYRPNDGLLGDAAGNLFGTTSYGGAQNDGIVFELSPTTERNSGWIETVLLSFSGANGSSPGEGLIADGDGNLFGTTSKGGTAGDGLIFELSPPGGGQTAWTETVLHSFNGADGEAPLGTLTADAVGNLYGTTSEGGRSNDGVAFRFMP